VTPPNSWLCRQLKDLFSKKKKEREKILNMVLPMAVNASAKTWVCGRSLAGITGSNPAGCIDVCLF
jgi:hypothetical protein